MKCEEGGEKRLVAFSCYLDLETPGHQRASATLPHRALRGRARGGQPVEAHNRADAVHGGAGRNERRARPDGAGRRIPPVGGALGAHLSGYFFAFGTTTVISFRRTGWAW